MRVSLIIPTCNGAAGIARLLAAIQAQTVPPQEILVIDSASEDGTAQLAASVQGVRVCSIERGEFDHGGTRDRALREARGDVVLFMTQDALPVNDRLVEQLLAPFADPRVAAVGARQIARPDARPFERAVRAHSYPAKSRVVTAADIPSLGVRAFLISNVCAAYRREAALAVGGFDRPVLTNEDMLMAEKLLHAGHALAYCGEAAVLHSHRLSLRAQFRRNLLIGRTMKRYEARFEHVRELGEGVALFQDVALQLLGEGQIGECCCFMADCAVRLLGNRAGRLIEGMRRAKR
ncbi:MAG: glycosyltransferase [Clostridiales bacterium]|nr:glycosyltransferase [Clostridiales bacterium]